MMKSVRRTSRPVRAMGACVGGCGGAISRQRISAGRLVITVLSMGGTIGNLMEVAEGNSR